MPCFHPIDAYKPNGYTENKKLIFEKHNPTMIEVMDRKGYSPLQVTCGQCVGCRLERSRQWAMRCMHEAQMHKQNSFITLTFNDPALWARKNPKSLDVTDFQKFMKRLRKILSPKKIRFYHCGEYGEKSQRPHYHACIFGEDFSEDRVLYKTTAQGHRLYTSTTLNKAWTDPITKMPLGYAIIGDLTFESAAYTARYIMKKQSGKGDYYKEDGTYVPSPETYYQDLDPETGEITDLQPEYNTMSRNPGIGKTWYNEYKNDVYPHDFVVVNGKRCRPPRYYDTQLQTERPYDFEEIQLLREQNAIDADIKHFDKHGESNNSKNRLQIREKCLIKNVVELLPRSDI